MIEEENKEPKDEDPTEMSDSYIEKRSKSSLAAKGDIGGLFQKNLLELKIKDKLSSGIQRNMTTAQRRLNIVQ